MHGSLGLWTLSIRKALSAKSRNLWVKNLTWAFDKDAWYNLIYFFIPPCLGILPGMLLHRNMSSY